MPHIYTPTYTLYTIYISVYTKLADTVLAEEDCRVSKNKIVHTGSSFQTINHFGNKTEESFGFNGNI